MKKIILATMALLLVSAVPSMAQTYRSDSRDARQQQRIVRGVVTGKLTPREARKVVRQQRRIDRTQARAARDGYITPAERRRIERQQNRASRNIARKTHNYRGY